MSALVGYTTSRLIGVASKVYHHKDGVRFMLKVELNNRVTDVPCLIPENSPANRVTISDGCVYDIAGNDKFVRPAYLEVTHAALLSSGDLHSGVQHSYISGILNDDLNITSTANGISVANFTVTTADAVVECQAWRGAANAVKTKLKPGNTVSMSGLVIYELRRGTAYFDVNRFTLLTA